MAGRKIGRVQHLYLNSSGVYASPSWVEAVKVGDVDINMDKATSEINTRETPNTKTIGGNLKIGLTFPYFRVDAHEDGVFDQLKDSYLNNTPIDMAAMETPWIITGAAGIRGPFVVTKFQRKEPVNEATRYDVELMETDDYSSDGSTAYYVQDYISPGD